MQINYKLFIILLFTFPSLLYAQVGTAPLYTPVYDFLERMETKGILKEVYNGTRPLSQKEIAEYLIIIRQKEDKLNNIELKQLESLEKEYQLALNLEDKRKYAIYQKQNEDYNFVFDLHYKRLMLYTKGDSYEQTDKIIIETRGAVIEGTLKEKVGFYCSVRDNTESGSRDYTSKDNYWNQDMAYYVISESSIDYDETEAYIYFDLSYFDLILAREALEWGPARRGNLLLNDNASPFDHFRLSAKYDRFKFTMVQGELISDIEDSLRTYTLSDGRERKALASKWLAAHRLELSLFDGLELGFQELIIYGERGFELLYLNPMMFYRSAEHYGADRDNAAMGVDFELYRFAPFKFYGAYFMDDIDTAKLFSDWYGNKWAFTLGLYIINPFKDINIDWRLEYTRIEPWVYTHFYPINRYTNHTSCLGYYLGPNADTWYNEINLWVLHNLHLQLYYERIRKGYNEPTRNIGGDVLEDHKLTDGENKKFLSGLLEKQNIIGCQIAYQPYRELNINTSIVYYQTYKEFFEDTGELSSTNFKDIQLQIGFSYNYNSFIPLWKK